MRRFDDDFRRGLMPMAVILSLAGSTYARADFGDFVSGIASGVGDAVNGTVDAVTSTATAAIGGLAGVVTGVVNDTNSINTTFTNAIGGVATSVLNGFAQNQQAVASNVLAAGGILTSIQATPKPATAAEQAQWTAMMAEMQEAIAALNQTRTLLETQLGPQLRAGALAANNSMQAGVTQYGGLAKQDTETYCTTLRHHLDTLKACSADPREVIRPLAEAQNDILAIENRHAANMTTLIQNLQNTARESHATFDKVCKATYDRSGPYSSLTGDLLKRMREVQANARTPGKLGPAVASMKALRTQLQQALSGNAAALPPAPPRAPFALPAVTAPRHPEFQAVAAKVKSAHDLAQAPLAPSPALMAAMEAHLDGVFAGRSAEEIARSKAAVMANLQPRFGHMPWVMASASSFLDQEAVRRAKKPPVPPGE